jgi:Ca-activated chloride channel homolog
MRRFLLVLLAIVLGSATLSRAQSAPAGRPEPAGEPDPGTGILMRRTPDGLAPLPALDIAVDLRVTGIMVAGTIEETFRNPTGEVIEALYLFPLPEHAAVDSMEMRIGDRLIRSVVRERQAARTAYDDAARAGKKAGLLEERPSHLFSTSVANINPGETVTVRLTYIEEIAWQEGRMSLSFPLTWSPRFTPAAHGNAAASGSGSDDEDGDGFSSGESAGGCFVPAADAAAPHVRIKARIEAGLPLGAVRSPSHPIRVTREATAAWVGTGPETILADRDFVLEWEVPGSEKTQGVAFVEERDGDRYALVMLLPPAERSAAASGAAVESGLPTRTLFLIDVSGSMEGPSIEQARRALLAALDRLGPRDTFDMMQFNDGNALFRDQFQPAVPSRLREAGDWVRGLQAGGGTEIFAALGRGMKLMAGDAGGEVKRIILITDGAVNGEEAFLRGVAAGLGDARLHVIGIGAAPNRWLMRRIARDGRGSCEFIVNLDEVEPRIDAFLTRINRPVLADLRLDWDGAPPLDAFPSRLPDLHGGEPIVVSLHLGRSHPGTRARLLATAPSGPVVNELAVPADAPQGAGIATRWAHAKVEELLDTLQEGADPQSVHDAVVAVAAPFNLVTRFTSLVAVEETPTAASAPSSSFQMANALPAGASQDGTLPQGGTTGPLVLRVGLLLILLGAAVIGLTRLVDR